MFVAIVISLVCFLMLIVTFKMKFSHTAKLAEKFPGPKCLPLLGNALEFGTSTADMYRSMERICQKWGPSLRIWIGPKLSIILTHPADLEIVMSNNKYQDKSDDYDFFYPWLGTGLLTSRGAKWRKHRKILTPTFHFKILEQFVDVFNSNGEILVDKLKKEENGPTFDIYRYITLSTLDNISESAMGVKVNAQLNSESEYVKAVRVMSEVLVKRGFSLWLRPDFLFRLSSEGRLHNKSLKTLHGTTNKIIKQRKCEIMQEKTQTASNTDAKDLLDDSCIGVKKRLAFLDLLIEASFDEGNNLSDEDIREEVDTFMFEGHDTTSSGISFTLWLLSHHQEVQEMVLNEMKEVTADSTGPLTYQQLQAMKYTERVIKEALRLYPSVPLYGRVAPNEITLHNGLVIPKGVTIGLVAFVTHQNPKIFPDPEKFDPDRFLPDNVQGRHPYAYVPFSAGSRNCIGQKFAMLEMKCTLAHVIRNYCLLPGSEPGLKLAFELILKSKTGIRLKIKPRG